MSFLSCLAKLQEEGTIDAERAARYTAEFDRLKRAYGKTMGEVSAADLASRDALDAFEFQALQERRQKMMQIQTQQALLTGLRAHVEGGGRGEHFAIGVMDHHEAVWGSLAVDNVRGGLFKLAWSRMNGFLSRYSRDLLGNVRNKAELDDVVRALRGEKVENVNAREMAAAVSDTLEWLRVQFNAAGGAIPKLASWGLPQSHDALAIAQAGLEKWRDFTRQHLDPSQMIDNTTGKAFASDEALDEALDQAWRNITSEGMDGAIPGAFTGEGKLANRRSDHRFLVFKDAASWLAYNERFGTGDVLDAITGHIDSMTRDIAAMRQLGPNPALSVKWLGDVLRKDALPTPEGGKTLKLEKKAANGANELDRMWRYYTGELTAVSPENRATARFFSGVRNYNIITKLGRAFLSALPTDPVFKAFTARFNGLPVAQDLGLWLKTFNPADKAHRAAAEHAGLIFNEMTMRGERMWGQGRGFNTHELMRRGADGLLRSSLLTPHTVAAKQALGLGFMKDWADNAGTAFEKLSEPKRLALQRYGIDASDWDRLRAVGGHEQDGVRILRPGDLARLSDGGDRAALDTATKFFSLIDSEGRMDTPGDLLRAQTAVATLFGSVEVKRGTIGGELLHSATQFKTYSVIMVMTHLQRALYGRGGMGRVEYGLMLPIFLTMGGVAAYSLKTIAFGEDPPPLDDPETWARGFVQGGGLGVVGDLASAGFSGQAGMTGPVTSFFTGPTMGTVIDPLVSLTLGNAGEAARGEDTNFGREAFRQFKNNVPGGTLWYAQLAVNRLMLDQLNTLADPNYRQSWRRMERGAREQGTDFWWPPGETAPDRAPDFSNVFGEETIQ